MSGVIDAPADDTKPSGLLFWARFTGAHPPLSATAVSARAKCSGRRFEVPVRIVLTRLLARLHCLAPVTNTFAVPFSLSVPRYREWYAFCLGCIALEEQ